MPTYTLRNKRTEQMWQTLCSYDEMKVQLNEEVELVLSTAQFVSQVGGTLSKTSSDYRDNLKNMKKHFPGNTIKT